MWGIVKGKIIFISPDKKLAQKAAEVISELNEKIEVFQGSLSEGVKIAKEAVKKGVNIVISRGGTGNLIKKNLEIPVVNVEINGYDIIHTISHALEYSNQIGVVGFENLVNSADRMKEKMQKAFPIEIATAKVKSEREIDAEVYKLFLRGIKVFIGGDDVVYAARKYGCHGMLLESGKEAIIEAIREAKHILEIQLREKEKAQMLKSIIDFAYDGIIGIDSEGKITVFNPVAEKLTGCPAHLAIGKIVDSIVENTRMLHVLKTGKAELGEFQHIGDTTIVTNRVPIIVNNEVRGAVATFQEVEKIQKIERKIRHKLYLKGHVAKARFSDIVGKSKKINEVKNKAMQFAGVNSTVLIIGETGTGKELFAQSIHNASPRADKPFVAVNCAALPENLLESELFGYVEGAFTGARKGGKPGLFELAHSGTIFLDEISEMSPKLQARFLRVLQEKEVIRIGDDRVIPIDIRIIAASNRDLYNLVKKGNFREDLFYRLCVLQLVIPPLRERKEDIIDIVKFFVNEKSRLLGKEVNAISYEAMNRLMLYEWPGNVRELENVIERAVVLCKGQEIGIEIISEALNDMGSSTDNCSNVDIAENAANEGVLKYMEDEMIKRVLEETRGNKTLAAKKLGISVTTLWRRLKQIEEKQ
ncbi:MAG: sigma 54-interacting transcriptional regulator [Firmicutes bacterium]|nr:sigma 54-interacting transcriptional regulator [Bacillota bacterium]